MYGKIIDGKLELASNPMTVGKYKIYNPRPEQYEAEGYLKIIAAEYPTDADKLYVREYAEQDGAIYEVWVEAKIPERTPSLEERVSVVESQITDTELALCGLYEALCAADGKEV